MVEVQRVEIVFGNVLKIAEVELTAPLGLQWLTVEHDQFLIRMQGSEAMYNLPIDHTVKMQVSYTDSAGNPATVDGDVEWFPANPEIAKIEVDESDSTICKVIPVALGRTQVSAKADADLGEGVRELLTVCDIMIVAGEAVAGSIQPTGEQEPIGEGEDGGTAKPPVQIDNTLPGRGSAGGEHIDNTLPPHAQPKR